MNKLNALAAGLLLAACSGPSQQQKESSQVEHATGPEWVTRGSGAFASAKGRVFYGVGIASGIRNAAMRMATADARARLEVGNQLDGFVSRISNTRTSGGAAGKSADGDALKTYLLTQTTIVDHWVDNDGSEWALAQLEMDKAKSEVDKAADVDSQLKQALKTNGDKAFDELNAENGRRPR